MIRSATIFFVQTLQFIVLLIVFGLAFRTKAATPTTNPLDIESAAIEKIEHLAAAPGTPDPTDLSPGPDADRFLADRQEALTLLRQAATLPQAYYEADPTFSPVLKSLNGPRSAVNLLVLSGESNVANGRFDAGVDDLMTAIAVGRHVGQKKLFVNRLVEIGCESTAMQSLAKLLPKLPDDVVAKLPAKLAALPPLPSLAETIKAEWAFGLDSARDLAASKNPPPDAPQFTVKVLEACRPMFDAAIAAAEKSPADFARAVDVAAAKLLANPYAQVNAPSLRLMRATVGITEAQRGMLLTAVAVRRRGPAAVADSHDPFGHGPFTYAPAANGYRLGSALTTVPQGTPVTLTVGDGVTPAP